MKEAPGFGNSIVHVAAKLVENRQQKTVFLICNLVSTGKNFSKNSINYTKTHLAFFG